MGAGMRWCAIGLGAALGIVAGEREAAAQPVTSATMIMLAIDGEWAGRVAEMPLGSSAADDIVIHFDASVSNRLLAWANDALAGHAQKKSGALVRFDLSRREVGRREFGDASIVEIGLPGVDAASRDASFITMRLRPEGGRFLGPANPPQVYSDTPQPIQLLRPSYRVTIDGLNTQRISRTEPITRGSGAQQMLRTTAGKMEPAAKPMPAPGRMQVPVAPVTVVMYVAAVDQDSWNQWLRSAPAQKKNGWIEWLAPALNRPVFRAALGNLGIVRIDPVPGQGDSTRMLRVQMTAEAVTVTRPSQFSQ